MVALLFLVLSFFLGTSLLRKMKISLNVFELASGGMVLGTMISIWITYLASYATNQKLGIMISLLAMAVITIIFSLGKKQPLVFPRFSSKEVLTYIFYTVFWTAILFPLFVSHMLEIKSDGLYSGGGAWGDMALHTTFIHKFRNLNEINLVSPIYSKEKTTYPFLFDYYGSILMRSGLSIQAALILSGFLFSMLFLQLSFFLIYRMFKSASAGFIFSLLLLFNGGIGIYYFYQDWIASSLPLTKFLFMMKVEYAHLGIYGLRFSNLIADYLLPQRAFLVGLPAFTLAVLILRTIWLSKNNHWSLKFLLCLIIGLLPFFHMHTFLALVGLLVFYIFVESIFKHRNPINWLPQIAMLITLALPQLSWQFGHSFGQGFIRFQYGWMKGSEDILVFWLRNLGIELIFFIFGGLYLLVQNKEKFLKLLFVAFTILFVITNFIIFQPHDYDNMKLMIYFHLTLAIMATWVLLKIARIRIVGKILTLILVLVWTITGILSVLRESYTSWKIADTSDVKLAELVNNKTEPDAVFLTADNHNHPISMLSGRSIVMGYRGWLWTHGINYSQTEKDVNTMFVGGSNTTLLFKTYNISYVFIGPAELNNYQADINYYRERYPILLENEAGVVFDVRGSPIPNIANKESEHVF